MCSTSLLREKPSIQDYNSVTESVDSRSMRAVWDQETLYFSGDQYFSALLQAIASATRTISFEVYIFEKCKTGDRIINELIRAAQRGVQIRLIIDGLGSPEFARVYLPQLKQAKIRVKFYRAIPWLWQRLPGEASYWILRVRDRFKRVNKGNHRKYCLIDNKKLFVGSFNVSDIHSESLSGAMAWRDLAAEVEGPEIAITKSKLLLTNESFLRRRFKQSPIVKKIKDAQKRIWIETPYFVPTGKVIRSLIKAAKRKVDVSVVVPMTSDVWAVQWMSLSIIHHLTLRGVKVYVYGHQFNHRKIFILDDWMCLGSSNLNHRSLLHDLEMDVVITHESNKAHLEESCLKTHRDSVIYQTNDWQKIPRGKRWLGNILLYLRYWA